MTNVTFEKLSAAGKRVAIARDAIRQLRAGRVVARKGVYLNVCGVRGGEDLRDVLRAKSAKPCEACGVGVLLVACVRQVDGVSVMPARTYGGECRMWGEDVFGKLREFFADEQLKSIERAFEGECPYTFKAAGGIEREIFEAYPASKRRLLAILKNVVRHNGRFRPGAADLPKAAALRV